MRAPRVSLYSRPDCHLCEQARSELEAMREAGDRFEIEEIDIERDDRLLARYVERIPVIELDGVQISELGLDRDGLRARLATLFR